VADLKITITVYINIAGGKRALPQKWVYRIEILLIE